MIFLSLILLTGCASLGSSKEEKHQMELNLHKVRTGVEEVRHELNSREIEYHVLDGKFIDLERAMAHLKKQINELQLDKFESLVGQLQAMGKSVQQLAVKQDKIVADIRQLRSHANETTTALVQYKEKITQFEQFVALQNQQLKELIKLKEGGAQCAQFENKKVYKIKSGDSLEKIAREQGTSVEEIKKLNQMTSDLIVVDQTLYLP